MSDYLPELVVADKEEEEEPKPITHPLGDETDEEELPVKLELESDCEETEEDDGPPEPPAKPSIPHERIFKPLKVKPVIDDTMAPVSKKKKVNFATSPAAVEAVIDIIVNEDPPTAKPKIKKPRKKMSQGQLDALARGRATSLANRQKKAKQKAEPIPEPKPIPVPEPVVEDKPEPVKVFKGREPQSQVIQGYTKDDMDNAINNALNKQYELRKERKKKKKAAEQINQVDTRLVEQINRAMDPSNPEYWSSCFNIT